MQRAHVEDYNRWFYPGRTKILVFNGNDELEEIQEANCPQNSTTPGFISCLSTPGPGFNPNAFRWSPVVAPVTALHLGSYLSPRRGHHEIATVAGRDSLSLAFHSPPAPAIAATGPGGNRRAISGAIGLLWRLRAMAPGYTRHFLRVFPARRLNPGRATSASFRVAAVPGSTSEKQTAPHQGLRRILGHRPTDVDTTEPAGDLATSPLPHWSPPWRITGATLRTGLQQQCASTIVPCLWILLQASLAASGRCSTSRVAVHNRRRLSSATHRLSLVPISGTPVIRMPPAASFERVLNTRRADHAPPPGRHLVPACL